MKALFSTDLAPCPYLAGRSERRLVSVLAGPDPDADHDRLLRGGFRRSQRFAYRPACPGCTACVPVRIPVARFTFTRSWRRILHRNGDLAARERPPHATEEQYLLFERYLNGRHDQSGMTDMTFDDYQAMVAETSVTSHLVEWRDPGHRLMAVSLTDRTRHALSGVYKFFEPDESRRSLGSHIILWHVERARELGLDHVYLGYWIAESPKMAYKARFQPLEQLTPHGWRPLPPVAAAADALPAERPDKP
ncbi:MAG TPA: arginyltransferase [Geminicoccaceae bacterium]